MIRLAFLFALACCAAGCAATNGGVRGTVQRQVVPPPASVVDGGRSGDRDPVAQDAVDVGARTGGHARAVVADSSALTFTAPSFGSLGCEPDTAKPLHGGQRVYLLRLKGQVPNYWPGMMQTVAGMDSVRLLTRPDTVWRAAVQPGVRCSVRVAAGEYVAETVGQRCPSWRVVRVP